GVIEPTLDAGRDLGPSDTSGVMLVSQDYADALGFKNAYANLIGQTVDLTTTNGYTGIGAVLPSQLPPQDQCGPDQRQGSFCGRHGITPTVLHARVVGVVSQTFQHQTLFIPLSWMIGIANQARIENGQQPQRLPQPTGNQPCRPGSPCGPGPQCQPSRPCGR